MEGCRNADVKLPRPGPRRNASRHVLNWGLPVTPNLPYITFSHSATSSSLMAAADLLPPSASFCQQSLANPDSFPLGGMKTLPQHYSTVDFPDSSDASEASSVPATPGVMSSDSSGSESSPVVLPEDDRGDWDYVLGRGYVAMHAPRAPVSREEYVKLTNDILMECLEGVSGRCDILLVPFRLPDSFSSSSCSPLCVCKGSDQCYQCASLVCLL